MNRYRALAAGLMLSAALVVSGPAQAMEIRLFDKMASEDKGEYVSQLVGSAEQALNTEGRADLAAQVEKLFTTTLPGDQHTLGIVEFQLNLARARVTDAKNVEKNPSAQRLEVEDAFAVTLKKNHIDLPDNFFTVLGNFRPKYPLQQ